MINLPPLSALPDAVRKPAQAYQDAAVALEALRFSVGGIDGLSARQEAEDLDRALMLDAIRDGLDPIGVGQPNEMARRARSHATDQAIKATAPEVARLEVTLGEAILEHRTACIDAARKSLPATAKKYAAAVDAMLTARTVYEDDLQLRTWAGGISDGNAAPNFSAGEQASLRIDNIGSSLSPDELRARLHADATRHEQLEVEETKRAEWTARDQRAQAILAAAAATLDADLERMRSDNSDPQAA